MLKGCFYRDAHGSVTLCSNKMNYQEYLQVLGYHVLFSMDFYFSDGNEIFPDDIFRMKDGIVQDWFIASEGTASEL